MHSENSVDAEGEEELSLQRVVNVVPENNQPGLGVIQAVEALVPRHVMDKLTPPSCMLLTGNLADNWKRFKQRFNIYLAASGAGGDDDKLKASIFLHVIGEDVLDIYNSFQLDEDTLTLTVLITKFEEYFVPSQNVTFERYKFFTHDQKQGVPFDQYLAELHTLSKTCEFAALKDSFVKDRIVCGIYDNVLRERLLRETELTLENSDVSFVNDSFILNESL